MDQELALKLVQYVEYTNDLLEKYAERIGTIEQEKEQFHEKLAQVIDIMVDNSIIPEEYSEAIYNDLKDSPEKVAEFMTKIIDKQPLKIGEASNMISSKKDAIVEFCFG